MYHLLILFFGAGLSSASVASRHSVYRDYTYVEEFNAFYKFYCDSNGGNWSSTYKACEEEGAELFYPRERDEWTIVKKLVEAQPHPPIVANVFVGERGKINVTSLETYGEGRCVTLHTYTGDLMVDECTVENGTPRSFVCKKAGDVPTDAASEIIYYLKCTNMNGYYHKETKTCYKFHEERMPWSRAKLACIREGGHLLILESEAELNLLLNKIPEHKKYYIGYSKSSSDTNYYTTVLGDKVNLVAGKKTWGTYGSRNCAQIHILTYESNQNLYIDGEHCNEENYFICEIKNI